jgi:hypothetical protein
MYEARRESGALVVKGFGELPRAELAAIAALAADARRGGVTVVIDLRRVTHLHYAGARLLGSIPGVRAACRSRYVRNLVRAGAGGFVELFDDLEEAVQAA